MSILSAHHNAGPLSTLREISIAHGGCRFELDQAPAMAPARPRTPCPFLGRPSAVVSTCMLPPIPWPPQRRRRRSRLSAAAAAAGS